MLEKDGYKFLYKNTKNIHIINLYEPKGLKDDKIMIL